MKKFSHFFVAVFSSTVFLLGVGACSEVPEKPLDSLLVNANAVSLLPTVNYWVFDTLSNPLVEKDSLLNQVEWFSFTPDKKRRVFSINTNTLATRVYPQSFIEEYQRGFDTLPSMVRSNHAFTSPFSRDTMVSVGKDKFHLNHCGWWYAHRGYHLYGFLYQDYKWVVVKHEIGTSAMDFAISTRTGWDIKRGRSLNSEQKSNFESIKQAILLAEK